MAEQPQKDPGNSAITAILGWGGLALFTVAFAWIIITQLQDSEEWSNRGKEAVVLVREFKPDGGVETMEDLTKAWSLKAKDNGGYVGEFSWDAKQKDGPEYEVTLLWKEGSHSKVALWRVDLKQKEGRPQGDTASGLPARAKAGSFDS
jgi:hypothetical protein